MRLKNVPGAKEAIEQSSYVVQKPKENKGKWKELFKDSNKPLHIEIGMGKGKFLTEMARLHPDINYVGIEKFSSVLIRAVQKLEEDNNTDRNGGGDSVKVSNILLICTDAEEIEEVFANGEVDRIYLNFSDPWPKDRHSKRRLPSRQYLKRYDSILRKEGTVEFKTDNRLLFDFALEELEPAGWKSNYITFDLHKDQEMMDTNVMTEYEEKFSSIGNLICKYVISR